jgi:hypothetical protein
LMESLEIYLITTQHPRPKLVRLLLSKKIRINELTIKKIKNVSV